MKQHGLNICVVGTGYVGLTTGVCLAVIGHRVTCIDIDKNKIDLLLNGKSPIYEPGLEELMKAARTRLEFTTSYSNCSQANVIIMAVGTPPTLKGMADVSYLETAALDVARYLPGDRPQVIVNKSTVPIGTAKRIKLIIDIFLDKAGKTANYMVASNPEFLREGAAVHDTLYPDRIVLGSDSIEAIQILRTMYEPILEQTFAAPQNCPRTDEFPLPGLITTDAASAEMIKYASNAFLATKISFINEIGGLCEKVGANVTEVARGIGLDKRIGSRFLQAGVGWGGSCFGKDLAALNSIGEEYSYELSIISATSKVNLRQRKRVIEKLQETLKVIRGRTVTLFGLAFKPNTDDLRDAPALDIIHSLLEMGARVKAYDPVAINNCRFRYPDLAVEYFSTPLQAAAGCDAVILVTEWEEFRQLSLSDLAEKMCNEKVLIDGRNLFNPEEARQAGLQYIGFGR